MKLLLRNVAPALLEKDLSAPAQADQARRLLDRYREPT
jgi:hypothetical protein